MKTIHSRMSERWIDAVLVILFLASLAWLTYGNILAGSELWQLFVSILILSIPLGLFYFTIGLLIHAYRQRQSQGRLDKRAASYLYLAPRAAGILIIIFVSLFALDVFDGSQPFWEMLGGFIIHALPAIVLALLLVLAWRREWIGALAFLAAGLFFLRFMLGGWPNNMGILLLFSGPMLMIAALFWVNWKWREEIREAKKESH